MKKHFFSINLVLLGLLPFFLVTGPLIPEIILLISLIYLLTNKNKIFFSKILFEKRIFFCVLIFNFLIILSSVLSDYKLDSLKNTLFYSRYIFFSIVVAYFCFCNDKLAKLIFYCFAVVYFLIFFGALIEFIFNYNLVYGFKEGMIIGKDNLPTAHAYEEYKISSLFGDEWVMGSFISRTMPFYFGLFFLLKKNLKKLEYNLFYLSLLFAVISVFFSGERLALFFLMLFFLIFISTIKYKKIINFKVLILLFFFILGFFIIFKDQRNRYFSYTYSQITNGSSINFYSKEHHSHFVTAMSIFKDNFWLGIGPKNFYKVCIDKNRNYDKRSCTTHPHNFFAQLLSETGIIGTIIPIFLFFFIGYKLLKQSINKLLNKKELYSNFAICCMISFFISLIPFTPNGSFFNNWLNIIFYLPLGFYMFYRNKHE